LFLFKADQSILEIAGLKIGGQPGQLPTVMIGSIFYHGDKNVLDEKKGVFDHKKAEDTIRAEEEISDKTGNPRILDVCASWPEALPKYIDFVASATNGPFSIDGTTADVRIAGAKYVEEAGLSERAIYNSISPHTQNEEIFAIKDAKIKSAIMLALNSKNPTMSGRLEVMHDLLGKARTTGIEKMIIDTTVLDMPDPGPSSKAIYIMKDRYGFPTGCGAHNAIDIWHKLRKIDHETKTLCGVTANVIPITMGADFILYGPASNAHLMYTPVAVADAYIAYSMSQEYGVRPLTRNHPLYRVFRK